MFETLYKLYHQKNTFHLFIISFIVEKHQIKSLNFQTRHESIGKK
jgi:hypothetical protein